MSVNAAEAGRATTVSGRRYVTVLFCDLVGSTELSERLDPEDLQALQQRYHEAAMKVIEAFGGFVASFSGDGILAYFGYPQARENDPERAVRAGLEAIAHIAELDVTIRHERLPSLAVRIGVHTGLVVIGTERSSARFEDHAITGEAVNLASRLQNEAPTNSVVVSGETLALVEGLFDSEPLGRKKIKGLKRLIPVHKIVGPRVNPIRPRRLSNRGATRMVGRSAELERVVQAWQRSVRQPGCKVACIVGEAGVGKTRLALEACQEPELRQATIIETHCQEIFANAPLQPVAGYLWAAAGIWFEDSDETKYAKLSELLGSYNMDNPENVATAASLLGVSAGPSVTAQPPTPLLQKQKQFDFVITLIAAIAKRNPAILWIEDAHWLDPSSTELLARLVAELRDLPIFVLITARTFPARPDLPKAEDIVGLSQLPSDDCLALARSVPGSNALSDTDLERAVDSAEGIPLYVEQLILSLIDEGGGGKARAGLPLSLAELMSEHLDRLPSGRRVVQAAACIGRSFTAGFLSRVLDEVEDNVVGTLGALVGAEVLRHRPEGGERAYEFRHTLLQQMAHESIPLADRRIVHGRIADLLMEAADIGPALPELVAHHLTEASRYTEAIQGWLGAGMRAAQRSAHTEAIEHLRRGLSLLVEIADPAARRNVELALQAALIGSLTATRGSASREFSECCDRGLALARDGDPTPLIFPFLFGRFVFAIARGRSKEAAKFADAFLETAEQAKFESGKVVGYRLSAMAHLGLGQAARARSQLERSLALYDPERDEAATHMFGQNTQVHSRALLSLSLLCLGEIEESLSVGISALDGADAIKHPHSTAIALGYFGGWVLGWLGVPSEMMAMARRLIALAEQHRLGALHAFGTAFFGWALCQNDDLVQGISVLEQAISEMDAVENLLSRAGHLTALADAQRRAGRMDLAVQSSQGARKLVDDGADVWLAPEVMRVQALVARDAGGAEAVEAETLARSAVAKARELGFPLFELRCLDTLAEIAGREPAFVQRAAALSRYRNVSQLAVRALRRRRVPSG